MKLPTALLLPGLVLWIGVQAQNDTYNAQRVAPSLYTPASSPAKCSPYGYITVTEVNQPEAKTVTSCGEEGAAYGRGGGDYGDGGYGGTKTVTKTEPCTKASTVTSYQNCIPVSQNPQAGGGVLELPMLTSAIEKWRWRLSKQATWFGRRLQQASATTILQYNHRHIKTRSYQDQDRCFLGDRDQYKDFCRHNGKFD